MGEEEQLTGFDTTAKKLIAKRSNHSKQWLNSGKITDRREYVALRQGVAIAVNKDKDDWLQEKAKEIESRMQSVSSRRGV